jgi:hypothetical protein
LADRDEEGFKRNHSLIGRMAAPTTTAQILAYLDEELGELIQLAVRMNEDSMLRRLHAARRELCEMKRVEDLRVCPETSGRIAEFSEHEAD